MRKTTGWRQALLRAADLLSRRGAWTRNLYARRKDGLGVEADSPEAVCWCAVGALNKVATPEAVRAAEERVEYYLGDTAPGLVTYNDSQSRKAPVIRLLRKVAKEK